jgi:protein involved in polysaccharide export with SLBB domain
MSCARLPSALLAAAFAFLASACSSSGVPLAEITSTINATLRHDDVVLAGDQLEVRFSGATADASTWNFETLVRPDGSATFLRLGDRPVQGHTIDALRKELTEAYTPQLDFKNAAVNVFLKSKVARELVVMGEVHLPGKVSVDSGERITLLAALGRAGGPVKETARLDSTLLVRWDPLANRQVSWKIDADVDNWATSEPLYLQPFDVVFVPNTSIDKVDNFVDQYFRRLLPFPIDVSAVSVKK